MTTVKSLEIALAFGCPICLVIGCVLGIMHGDKIRRDVHKEFEEFMCETCKHEKWELKEPGNNKILPTPLFKE